MFVFLQRILNKLTSGDIGFKGFNDPSMNNHNIIITDLAAAAQMRTFTGTKYWRLCITIIIILTCQLFNVNIQKKM